MRAKFSALYLLLGVLAETAEAQMDYGMRLGLRQGAETSFRPQGPGVMLDALDPAVRRWYVPQELYNEYGWRQWEYTNYARDHFERYVNTALEGDYFYDIYGNFVTRGWLIFNNTQTRPQQFGNTLFKSERFRQWFSEVVVAGDQKGEYAYALTLSSQLRTTLTPMTFSKPRMDGVQFDLATDRYETTLIYSRISSPGGGETGGQEVLRTNNTTLVAGRFVGQIGEYARLGFNLANSHQSNTLTDRLAGNPFSGLLTVGQNRTIDLVQIVLRDDSPEDEVGGAAFFPAGSDVVITYSDGRKERGKDIGFEPVVEGGFVEKGFIAAKGVEEIRLLYDFDSLDFIERASAAKDSIVNVEFELVVGNDYQIWMTSNNQTNRQGELVLLLVDQARGNIKDATNLRTIRFAYGLPTATHIFGGTLELLDVAGFDLYAEYDLNWNYRKYPNTFAETHRTSSGVEGRRYAPAWMVNVAKSAHPFFMFGEVYSMDPLYNTSTFVTLGTGEINYESEREGIVELVEDNDDQDRFPDTVRSDWQAGDPQVFPGWDQNNDFVPDFNQNDNLVKTNIIPDYEEPFLRFGVDRPEFLFGVDMNNNFWVDQYENDEEPDYPYRRDHRGYNVYGGVNATPKLRLTAGVLREDLISSDQKNHSVYAALTFDENSPRFGRLRVFEMSKKVEDDIPNPLLQWSPDNTVLGGVLTRVDDPLLARDTWVNQLFVGHSLQGTALHLMSKLNYVYFRQLMGQAKRRELGLDETDFFLGLINKASYRYQLGQLVLEPRWKSEFRKQSRSLFDAVERTSLMQLFSTLMEVQLLQVTRLQAGVEYVVFNDFDIDAEDFNSLTVGLQFANTSAYHGYQVMALAGIALERRDFKEAEPSTTSRSFVTIYAGLE